MGVDQSHNDIVKERKRTMTMTLLNKRKNNVIDNVRGNYYLATI